MFKASSKALSAVAPLVDKFAAAELSFGVAVEELLFFLHAVIKIAAEISTIAIEKRVFKLVFMVVFLFF